MATRPPRRPRWPFPHVTRMHAHGSGQWAKKIHGRRVYFGVWADPDAALARWRATDESVRDRRATPDTPSDFVTVDEVVNRWLAHQVARVEAGDLSSRTLRDYQHVATWIGETLGWQTIVSALGPAQWAEARLALSRQYGLHRQTTTVVYVRSCFRWAEQSDIIARPVRFGPNFAPPGARAVRMHASARKLAAPRLFTSGEIRKLVAAADAKMLAMIWLACNAALGQTDISTMEAQHVRDGWLMLPRRKTGVLRRVRLWPETMRAIKPIIAAHPTGLLFPTRFGRPAVRVQANRAGQLIAVDTIALQFGKLARACKIKRTFYDFRRTFRTVCDEHPDAHAVDAIMGHVPPGMGAEYVQRIEDARRVAVTDRMRSWVRRSAGTRGPSKSGAVLRAV